MTVWKFLGFFSYIMVLTLIVIGLLATATWVGLVLAVFFFIMGILQGVQVFDWAARP